MYPLYLSLSYSHGFETGVTDALVVVVVSGVLVEEVVSTQVVATVEFVGFIYKK